MIAETPRNTRKTLNTEINEKLASELPTSKGQVRACIYLLLNSESWILALLLVAQDAHELSRPCSDVRPIEKVTNHRHRIRAGRKKLTDVLQSYPPDGY